MVEGGKAFRHGRMAKGGLGLPKVSLGTAICYPCMPCGQTTSETTLRLFQGWPTHRAGGLRPYYTLLDYPTPYAYAFRKEAESETSQKCLHYGKKI
jgi:hypothetical protein